MSKKYMYLFGAALLALSGVGASAQSVQAKSAHHQRTNVTRNVSKYFVNAPQSISSNARTITGTASKGFKVTLQNGKRVVASTYANSKTGRYTLSIPKGYKAGTHLTVTAQKSYWHPYKIVFVKTPANQKAAVKAKKASHKTARKSVKRPAKSHKVVKTSQSSKITAQIKSLKKDMKNLIARHAKAAKQYNNDKEQLAKLQNQLKNKKPAAKKSATKKSVKKPAKKQNHRKVAKRAKKPAKKSNKKVSRKATKKSSSVTIKDPNGNWEARQSKHYTQKWNLSQARGLNESLYHNGRYAKKLVNNAPYKVNVNVKNNVWGITYQPNHNSKASKTIYMHFLSNNHFKLTNQQGRKASLSFVRY